LFTWFVSAKVHFFFNACKLFFKSQTQYFKKIGERMILIAADADKKMGEKIK